MFEKNKHYTMKLNIFIIAGIALLSGSNKLFALRSTLTRHDVFPLYSTVDPMDKMLVRKQKLELFDAKWADDKGERFFFSAAPFAQNADRGKPMSGGYFFDLMDALLDRDEDELDDTDLRFERCTRSVPLMDLTGRTPMIPLVFGDLPQGRTLGPLLQEAQSELFSGQLPPINDENVIDPCEEFGYFTFFSKKVGKVKYRKRGIRFDMSLRLSQDFGFNLQTGVASICQTRVEPTDLTKDDTTLGGLKSKDVQMFLMERLDCIAQEIKLDLAGYQKTSIEEVRAQLYWRHIFNVDPDDYRKWPHFLFIPYLQLGASFSPEDHRDYNKFYSLAFGNNGHHSIGLNAGLAIDFAETIEISGEVGYLHFFDQTIDCFRVPNSKLQNNIFPFRTSVELDPGHNWHFAGKIAAHHFLDNLSMFFEYIMVEHAPDEICLKKADSAFKPEVLERQSGWKAKLANIGFNYDISPNITLGFLWQAPLSQRNTYRSTTLLFSISGTL